MLLLPVTLVELALKLRICGLSGVAVAVKVAVAVLVGVSVKVGVMLGVKVAVGRAVLVAVGVRVGVGVLVALAVLVGVGVSVKVGVRVSVGVRVGVVEGRTARVGSTADSCLGWHAATTIITMNRVDNFISFMTAIPVERSESG
jgi:hypothetical protein